MGRALATGLVLLAALSASPAWGLGAGILDALPRDTGLLDGLQNDAGQAGDAEDACSQDQHPEREVREAQTYYGQMFPVDDTSDQFLFLAVPGKPYTLTMNPDAWVPRLPFPTFTPVFNYDADVLLPDCSVLAPSPHLLGSEVERVPFTAPQGTPYVILHVYQPARLGYPTPVLAAPHGGAGAANDGAAPALAFEANPPPCIPGCYGFKAE
jgi:hypothetical protein